MEAFGCRSPAANAALESLLAESQQVKIEIDLIKPWVQTYLAR
jgi:hypothetical protein